MMTPLTWYEDGLAYSRQAPKWFWLQDSFPEWSVLGQPCEALGVQPLRPATPGRLARTRIVPR